MLDDRILVSVKGPQRGSGVEPADTQTGPDQDEDTTDNKPNRAGERCQGLVADREAEDVTRQLHCGRSDGIRLHERVVFCPISRTHSGAESTMTMPMSNITQPPCGRSRRSRSVLAVDLHRIPLG